ncbi:cache domain-containing sensor histidine kinase [Lachnoclostridium phytofermentans]|uniref:histidine kinase n=1 Tax=Lachnoclostridium phytofermentans (strain ATCC 700394 / DSM 18823 / ISDg) TaxID=357809 RepID=A9KK43_LACP7|nr:sensor histidine kinase [Lachnoclostridium phytofermentans]ABX42615.1 histidine kinase internal region [Lachnoclostridium phytofermentans ISDg]
MRKKKISLSAIIVSLVVSFVAFILICALLLFFKIYLSSMEQNAITSSEQAVVQVSNTVGNYADDMKGIMDIIKDGFDQSEDEREDTLNTLMKVRTDLVAVYIYDENQNMVSSYTGEYQLKKEYLKNLSYVKRENYETGEIYISEPHVESLLENYYPWVVTILEEIENEDGSKSRVVFDISFSKIANYVDDVGIGQHGYCFIIGTKGEIIYHPQQQLIFSGLKEENTEGIADHLDGSYQDSNVIYTIKSLNNSDWRIVGVSYINELIASEVISVVKTLIIMLLLIMIVAMISSYVMSKVISKPIQKLMKAMEDFEQDAAGYSFQSVGGTTEIQALSQSFDHMVVQIQELMTKVRKEEITLRKTELKALQAQINPHFLYNTLDAIGWLCEEERSQDAVEMVNALAKLFRISISKGHELITIEKEVEHAKSYLKIENFRYKNQFVYEFIVEEECLPYYCNKITLQPIIENAIYHGLNRMVDDGHIGIHIYAEEEDIVMEVIDNGVGMTPEQIHSILYKEPGDKTGIGIKNVNDRIKIYFGEKYGILIESELDEGTCVKIRMPKIERENYEYI